MQRIPDKYYRTYNSVATSLGGLFFVVSLLAMFLPAAEALKGYGFGVLVAILSFVQIFYGVAVFTKLWQKNSWLAGINGSMIITLITLTLVNGSGQLDSLFLILWGILIFTESIFGIFGMFANLFLTSLYFALLTSGPLSAVNVSSSKALVLLGSSYVISLLGYFVLKRFYVDTENSKVKNLSTSLGNSKAQSEKLIESISDGILVINQSKQITQLNPAASKMTGWPADEATGIDASLVLKLQDESGKEFEEGGSPLAQLDGSPAPATPNFRLVSKDNSFLVVSLSVSPVLQPDGAVGGFVAVLRDVSQARADENRRADFISTASHEMRTPVAAIEGYLQLALNDKVAKIDIKARNFLEKALNSTHHLGQLFQDLLTSAKAEDGRLVSHPRVVEIGKLLRKTTDDLRFSAEKKGLLLDFKIGASAAEGSPGGKVVQPLYYANVDPDRLQEVITNLFDNAVKYSNDGKITVALTGDEDVVQVFIKDTGMGIPKEDVPHLFQKFYRVDNSSTRTIGGTGLGLFICKRIIDMYKGRIWVESEQGSGSTFYINLPRLDAQKAAKMQQKEAQQPQA
jgi:two-component system sensor histidine kinase VicK